MFISMSKRLTNAGITREIREKVYSIEQIDEKILGPVWEHLDQAGRTTPFLHCRTIRRRSASVRILPIRCRLRSTEKAMAAQKP